VAIATLVVSVAGHLLQRSEDLVDKDFVRKVNTVCVEQGESESRQWIPPYNEGKASLCCCCCYTFGWSVRRSPFIAG
jgi:hypothetical protein